MAWTISWKFGIWRLSYISYSYLWLADLISNTLYTPSRNPLCWGIFTEIASSRLFEFSKYYCEKCKWFLSICWRFNCFTKINSNKGVVYYGCISSPLIKGWSKILVFRARSSWILIAFPLKLEKNCTDFYFNVGILCLCSCQSY